MAPAPAAGHPLAEFQCPGQPVDQVRGVPMVALADQRPGEELVGQAVPERFDSLPQRQGRAGPLQQAVQPDGHQQQRAQMVHFPQFHQRGHRQHVAQRGLDLGGKAADQLDDQGIAEAGGVAVALEAQRVVEVAVAGRHLVAAHRLQQARRSRQCREETAGRADWSAPGDRPASRGVRRNRPRRRGRTSHGSPPCSGCGPAPVARPIAWPAGPIATWAGP